MFSSKVSPILRFTCVAAISWTVGCGLIRLGEDRVESQMELGSSQSACLTGGAAVISGFFDGTTTEPKLASLCDCMAKSLKLFGERTRGATAGVYSPQELRNFLETYFLPSGTRISDGLLAESMELKRTLLGGRADQVTQHELQQAIQVIGQFRTLSIRMLPHMPFTPDHISKMPTANMQSALDVMVTSFQDLGGILENTGNDYSFKNLDQLLAEFEKAWDGQEGYDKILSQTRKSVPLARQLKAVLISEDSSKISGNDWRPLFLTGARWYSLWLRYSHLNANHPSWLYGSGRETLAALGADLKILLTESIEKRPGKMIHFEDFDRLVDAMDPQWLVVGSKAVKPENLKSFIRPLVRRVMGGLDPGSEGRQAQGLTIPTLHSGFDVFERWMEGQRFIDQLFRKVGTAQGLSEPVNELRFSQEQLLEFRVSDVIEEAGNNPSGKSQQVARRLQQQIAQSRLRFTGLTPYLRFMKQSERAQVSFYDLTHIHWMDLLSHVLYFAYADRPVSPAPVGSGVRLANVIEFYDDFKPLGVDLNIFDPNGINIPQKRFLEANLFAYSANGDEHMTLEESTEELAMMISGKSQGDKAHLVIAEQCKKPGDGNPKDIYGYPLVQAKCLREKLILGLRTLWSNMPGMLHQFLGPSDARLQANGLTKAQARLIRDLEDVARAKGYSEEPYNVGDTEAIFMAVQYIETMYSRFDVDGSGKLDLNETVLASGAAFPVFRQKLKEASCLGNDKDLQAVFTYYLARGKRPGALSFIWWRYFKGPNRWKFEADQATVLAILADLSRSSSNSGGAQQGCAK